MHIYEQLTGRFHLEGGLTLSGYAGSREGRNNPKYQMVRNVGPLPQGRYTIGLPFHSPNVGPFAMRLLPLFGNQMFGRSGFLIHGDNVLGDASRGCIILPRASRELIARSGVRELEVVSGYKGASKSARSANLTIDAQVTPGSEPGRQ